MTTAKQTAFAAKLFARQASIATRHGAPLKAKTFEQDMIALDWNPENGRDVSAYINLHLNAAKEARMFARS